MKPDASVYLLYGEDQYSVVETAFGIIRRRLPDEQAQTMGLDAIEASVKTADEAEALLQRCLLALRTLAFPGEQRVVWLRDVSFLSDSSVSQAEIVKNRLCDLSDLLDTGLPGSHTFLLTATKVFRGSAFFKRCAARGEVCEFPLDERKTVKEGRARAQAAFREAGLSIGDEELLLFADKVGADPGVVLQEVAKLTTFLGDRRQVTADDIRAVVAPARDTLVWDLADAVGRRQIPEALGHLRQLLFQKEAPVRLLMSLEGRVSELRVFREAMDRGWLQGGGGGRGNAPQWKELREEEEASLRDTTGKDPRTMHPFRQLQLAQQAQQYTRRELDRALRVLLRVHEQIVSSAAPDALLLELALVRILMR